MPTILPIAAPAVNAPPVAPLEGPPVPPGTLVSDPPAQVAPAPAVTPPVPPPAMQDPQALQQQAIGDATQATKDQQAAAEAEARAQQEKNDAEAKAAEAQAAELRKRQEANDRQMQASEAARARLVDLADKADQDVGHFKFTDYKDTIPVGSKIGLIVGAALAGLQGKVDPLAQINKNIAQHFEKQKAELSTKEAFAKYRRQGVEDHDRHVNDQRLYLEFAERNYREAIAKEAEARGLRSGNAMALARAQQLAARIRAEGDAKLVDLADKYMQGEERRAHADLLRKKARASVGGGAALSGEAEIAELARKGEPFEKLMRKAVVLKQKGQLGKEDPRKVVRDIQAGIAAEDQIDTKNAALSIYDAKTGDRIGAAGTAPAAQKINDDLKTLDLVRGDTEALRRHVTDSKTGGAVAPFGLTEAARTRSTLANNLVTRMSGFRGLGAISTDDRKILEGIINGGVSGILGLNAKQLDEVLAALDRAERTTLQSQGIKKPAASTAKPDAPAKYQPGTIVKQGGQTYRFKGGDANDPKNYVLVL